MGIYKTNWFRGQNSFQVQHIFYPEKPEAVALADANARVQSRDVYPVPTSWAHSLFQQTTWDVIIKEIGTVSHMGPLTIGIRSFHPDGVIPDHYACITATDSKSNLI